MDSFLFDIELVHAKGICPYGIGRTYTTQTNQCAPKISCYMHVDAIAYDINLDAGITPNVC